MYAYIHIYAHMHIYTYMYIFENICVCNILTFTAVMCVGPARRSYHVHSNVCQVSLDLRPISLDSSSAASSAAASCWEMGAPSPCSQ